MKELIALLIVLIGGVIMTLQYFLNIPVLDLIYKNVLDWSIVISTFALLLAIRSLLARQFQDLKFKKVKSIFPLTTIISFFTVVILGLIFGIGEKTPVDFIYQNIQVPLQATVFSLLAFYISSAAYRAFRAKNFSSTVLLISGSIVIIGRIPLGDFIAKITTLHINGSVISLIDFPAWTKWILNVPNVGIKRAFIFGITLGIISTSLKVIFGIERGWLK